MSLSKLADAQVAWIIQEVARYIDGQVRQRAVPLSASQMAAMEPFFPLSTLDWARVVVSGRERIGNPPFYGQLV